MRRRTLRRGGFTIVELLVVVTIIALMLCLMMPAIQSAREAARRIQCVNNLRQLALAFHNYETHHQVLPPGVVNPTGPIHNLPDGLHTGWLVQLLPFMEQRGLFDASNPAFSVYDPENRTVAICRINSVLCPSDPTGRAGGVGQTNYAACHHDVEAPIDADNHGVFYLNSHIRQDDVKDGTSFTIYAGEKIVNKGDLGWMSGTRATLRNTGTSINAAKSDATPVSAGDLFVGGFASFHPGGANFIFGDGSIRFLKDRINPRVLQWLGSRADGEVIDEPL